MHEQSLMDSLIRKILEIASKEKGCIVTKVSVRLGALCHMDAAHFQEHFDISAKGTIAEHAIIETELCVDTSDPNATFVTLKSIDVAAP
jgi:Zn finger protein HypA/HybF involved in hydrogenase expression